MANSDPRSDTISKRAGERGQGRIEEVFEGFLMSASVGKVYQRTQDDFFHRHVDLVSSSDSRTPKNRLIRSA